MIGIKMTIEGAAIVSRCMENNLRINCTQGSILRFMPPMTVSATEIDAAIEILDSVLSEMS